MNKIYYSSMNKKAYLTLILTIIGLILFIFQNTIILTIGLVLITFLFDGLVNRDIFATINQEVYLITKRTNSFFHLIHFILLFIAFALYLSKFYFWGLLIFYLLYLEIFIMNIVISCKQVKFCEEKENIKELLSRKNFDFFIYSVESVEKYDKKRYRLQLVDKYDKKNTMDIVYTVSKYLNGYKEVIHLLEEKMEK